MLNLLKSTNHQDISYLYFLFSVWMLVLGVSFSSLIRLQQSTSYLLLPGEVYNSVVTYHGLVMLFFAIMPLLIGAFGNLLIPPLSALPDMVFPRVNSISFWMLPLSFLLLMSGSLLPSFPASGWTLYPPLSLSLGSGTDLCIFSLHLAGLSSILGSLNYMVTMLVGPSSLSSESLYSVTLFTTSLLMVLALPILAGGLTMLIMDRKFNTSFFDPVGGGDPVLWQHIFWFFGHPEVYIIILPAFGLISHILPTVYSSVLFGPLGMVCSVLSIAILGFLVWAHHMFTTGLSLDSRLYFSSVTILIGVPTSVKIYTWVLSMVKASPSSTTLNMWIVGFLSMFTLGGFSGVTLSIPHLNYGLHDTYYVVAHFHFVLSMAATFAAILGVIYVWPLFYGVELDPLLVKVHFWLTMTFSFYIFSSLEVMGRSGLTRRWASYALGLQGSGDFSSSVTPLLSVSLVTSWFFLMWESLSSPSYLVDYNFKPAEISELAAYPTYSHLLLEAPLSISN